MAVVVHRQRDSAVSSQALSDSGGNATAGQAAYECMPQSVKVHHTARLISIRYIRSVDRVNKYSLLNIGYQYHQNIRRIPQRICLEKKGYIVESDREIGKLTAKTIRRRFGLSTAAVPVNQRLGAREIGMIREAGITRIEICGFPFPAHFDYRDAVQVSEITTECRKQGVTIVSAHGPGLQYDCPYENVRRAVVK